ncbi:serine/threonine-protein phosphatase PP2A-2 catalytic subunit-like [Histomonas meleagridis]|uniref:serine/threonine-protein phosphatase PP2A-2 catalytic subunit-like n=1 Tax=Histomonas meleagridis TaxID=135588 RepID=UPI003559AB95|nr:serine/threonine-protein phosphatase PP2A-2 catalytic subunit-like [Histomonas meleagridis]KAH0800527.1 serine/threonine-protein phosphatase PP2A-2 catalytic subunit-like [Histomonas meleagridis]
MIDDFLNGKQPTSTEVKFIIDEATKIFHSEPNVLKIFPPLVLCGDIHGKLSDLHEILKTSGSPPITRYLFLGDYVDRGDQSVEVLMVICILKIMYKDSFFMIRGNHESMSITEVYGFRNEVLRKYGSESLYQSFESLFNSIPLAAVINNEIFCVHGGITSQAATIEAISRLNRFIDIPNTGPICELLWNDPIDENCEYIESTDRNIGSMFGIAATEEFFKANGIKMIIRAHQTKKLGFEYCQNGRVLTVFSASNYEKNLKNYGGIITIDENMKIDEISFQTQQKNTDMEALSSFVY